MQRMWEREKARKIKRKEIKNKKERMREKENEREREITLKTICKIMEQLSPIEVHYVMCMFVNHNFVNKFKLL